MYIINNKMINKGMHWVQTNSEVKHKGQSRSNGKSEHVFIQVLISIDPLLLHHVQPGSALITESVLHRKKLLKIHAVDHRNVFCVNWTACFVNACPRLIRIESV